jgi:hypothetical protein
MHRGLAAFAAALCYLAAAPAAQTAAIDVPATLSRVGDRIIDWYSRAQSIVSDERVLITPLRHDLSSDGFPRRLGYELRIAWDSDAASEGALPEPRILRELLTVNGRAPRPKDEPECMDPKPVTPEPLMMLLPEERDVYAFTFAGRTRVEGVRALMLDYKGIAPGTPEITWTEECVSVSLPGRSRGRIWIDEQTHDVLRIDERLMGMFDFNVPRTHQRPGSPTFMTIERADSTIRYRRVRFTDPDETLMLPSEVDTVTIVRNGGVQRTRITQQFSNYRRFVGDARIVQ